MKPEKEKANYESPHDLNAESGVLGSILMDHTKMTEAYETLRPEHFYSPRNRIIYDSMIELYRQSIPIDMTTLVNTVRSKISLEDIGGLTYITSLLESTPSSAHIEFYIQIVTEKFLLRSLGNVSMDILEMVRDYDGNIESLLNLAEKKIFDVTEKKSKSEIHTLFNVINMVFEDLEKMMTDKTISSGVKTGFTDLDNLTNGFQNGELIILAARPSMGKTAFALNIGRNAAVQFKVPVVIFSLEMSSKALATRMLCIEAQMNQTKLKMVNFAQNDWPLLTNAANTYFNAPIFIDEAIQALTPTSLRSKCRRLKAEKNLGLVIVDYLQLMHSETPHVPKQQQISDISRALKLLALELDIPVIALSQLSRGPEFRTDHRPMLADLRESGAIEQDADQVIFLYRDEYYNREKSEKPNSVEVIVGKNRNGPCADVELYFNKEWGLFGNLQKH